MINFTSIRNLSTGMKIAEICEGMQVEYSDPAGDEDSGNFGEVVRVHTDVRYKHYTEEVFNVYTVELKLSQGQVIEVSAGQLLACETWTWDEEEVA